MNANELRSLLESHDIHPLKARGQHFLLDEAVVTAMVDAADVRAGDRVVEIGPGPGILTEALAARGARIVAVEIDHKLADLVVSRFDPEQVTVIRRDAREIGPAELVRAFGEPGEYKVVANLPYAITSEILVKFLRGTPVPASVTVMVQREVADRVTARPPKMSAIAVTVQTMSKPAKVVNVPAGAFLPPPKVDSAVIHMDMRKTVQREPRLTEAMLRLAHAAFADKRRQLRKSLAATVAKERLEKAFVEANIEPTRRPETLTVEDWERLAKALTV